MSGVTAATDAGIHYSGKAGGVMFLFVLSFCHSAICSVSEQECTTTHDRSNGRQLNMVGMAMGILQK